MDIDTIDKKRKITEVADPVPETLDLESVLKAYIEANTNLLKVVAVLFQKVVGLEKVFNKDLFTQPQ